MDMMDSKNIKWSVIAEENGKQILKDPIPNEAVESIMRILIETQAGEMLPPNELVSNELKKLLESKLITKEIVSKLTGLSEQYLKKLLSGVIEPAETKKIMALGEIIQKLR